MSSLPHPALPLPASHQRGEPALIEVLNVWTIWYPADAWGSRNLVQNLRAACEFLTGTPGVPNTRDIENQPCGGSEGDLVLSPFFSSCAVLDGLPDLSELPQTGRLSTPPLLSCQANCLRLSPSRPVIQLWGAPWGQAVLSTEHPQHPACRDQARGALRKDDGQGGGFPDLAGLCEGEQGQRGRRRASSAWARHTVGAT